MFRNKPISNLQADDFIKELQQRPGNELEIKMLNDSLAFVYYVKNAQSSLSADNISSKMNDIISALQCYHERFPDDHAGTHTYCVGLIKQAMNGTPLQNPFFNFYHTYHTDLKKYLEGRVLTPTHSPTKG